ncbi:MAG: RagB/SusD family nutrient uptake outer membrane protein [Gemmatimonadales bacterium]
MASIIFIILVPAPSREALVSSSNLFAHSYRYAGLMIKLPFTKSVRVAALPALLLLSPALGLVQGCTDLTESPTSSIAPENFYRNEEEVIGGLASVYAQLRQVTECYYFLTELSSDEIIIPTRGTDWYDNYRFIENDQQAWGANSAAGLNDVNCAWNAMFGGVARANVALAAVDKVSFPSKPVVQAEIRTLRAYYYFLLQDMFGGVPIVTDTDIKPRERNTRAEVSAFIEKELKETSAVLPATWSAEMNGRMTKGAADAILASLYLNAEVFTGTVTTAGLVRGAARWSDAVAACDRILNSGVYSLASDWRSNFTVANGTSPEIIMAVKFLNEAGLGQHFLQAALHYSQISSAPWNGWATIADVYFAFDTDDQRTQIFLAGPQVNLETGAPVNDRSGNRLIFTPEIVNPKNATEGEGVRVAKWTLDPNHLVQENGNDYPTFRLGEIYLIKAEALNELGQTAAAVGLVNTIRARVFNPTKPVSAGISQADLRTVIMNERLFELTVEGKRRQDLIRFGRFTSGTWFNNLQARDPYRILMPIPQTQIETNPLLVQNAGY